MPYKAPQYYSEKHTTDPFDKNLSNEGLPTVQEGECRVVACVSNTVLEMNSGGGPLTSRRNFEVPVDAITSNCFTCGNRDTLVFGEDDNFEVAARHGIERVLGKCPRGLEVKAEQASGLFVIED